MVAESNRRSEPDAGYVALRLCPISLGTANEFVAAWHRHHDPVIQCIFKVGICDGQGVLRGVAIAEIPKGINNMTGDTIEVTRVATDGTKNACSMLYGACSRAAFALGWRKVITYTEKGESGASLRAAGHRVVAERPARKGWDTQSRPRDNRKYRSVQRLLWDKEYA
jgi:hypothetical protein